MKTNDNLFLQILLPFVSKYLTKFIPPLAILIFSNASAAEYHLYLLAGQSNMDGRGKTANLTSAQKKTSSSSIIFYRNPPHSSNTWKKLKPGFSIPPRFKGKLPSPTFGPEIGFTTTMEKAQPKQKFALIKGSKGGTNLRSDWSPGKKNQPETQGPQYRNFIETIKLATTQLKDKGHTFKLSGLLWHQGESDSKTGTEKHHKRLLQLISRIREDTETPELPVILGEVFDNEKRDKVRAAIRLTTEEASLTELVSSEGTTTSDPGTHFDAKSQLLLGQRFAAAILEMQADTKPITQP